jgi:hypothetical protein
MSKVDQLLELEATVDAAKSLTIWGELSNNVLNWVCYDGKLYPDKLRDLAERYVTSHSYIDLPFDVYYTTDPLGVFRWEDKEIGRLEGIFYGNGAICKTTLIDGSSYLRLWIDPDTVRLFGYPETLNEQEISN